MSNTDGKAAGLGLKTIYSFVVDASPRFAYQAYYLARSLAKHGADSMAHLHVHFTPAVSQRIIAIFSELGCTIHQLEPFGDKKFCNKIAQLEALLPLEFDRAVLLDTDMIAVSDLRPFLKDDILLAKPVDQSLPRVKTLKALARLAGMKSLPAPLSTDTRQRKGLFERKTLAGNCNGGFYSIPRKLAERINGPWRRWALWLLEHDSILRDAKKLNHVDQTSMWLTINMEGIPFRRCSSNVNYFLHLPYKPFYYDPAQPIALLHYHDASINTLGLIEPIAPLTEAAAAAVKAANDQIGESFHNQLFWDMRYDKFPERGSGVGSKGHNLELKRGWLAAEKIESAASVLDVGCGNLELVRNFRMNNYLGLDQSDQALETARKAQPNWAFRAVDLQRDAASISGAEMVICFEVLIHQPMREAYDRLINFLADKAQAKLIVSGYEDRERVMAGNHMIFFYEPLSQSLKKTGKFRTIEKIGSHSDVEVFRCIV